MLKSLCVIPSRYASERLPGKPLLLIKGKSLIQRVWERVHNAGLFDKVIVATDDKRIYKHVHDFGGSAAYTSKDCGSGTERLIELSKQLSDFDIYFNVQGDEPLIPSKLLSSCIDTLKNVSEPTIVTASTTIQSYEIQDPNSVKVITDRLGYAMYFSRAPIPFCRKGEWKSEMHAKHIGLYGFTKDALEAIKHLDPTDLEEYESLEQLRWLYHGVSIKVITSSYKALGVDVPEDIVKVEKIIDDQQLDV